MKRISAFSIICLLCAVSLVRGQENAAAALSPQEIEENYKSLKGHVQDMIDAQAAQDKRLQAMAREIAELRDQMSKPTGNYATQEELKRLADVVQEIDRKRVEDKEAIIKEIAKLGKTLAATPVHTPPSKPIVTEPVAAPKGDETGFTYQVKPGDALSIIAQAYREQGVKVTVSQILAANPGLDATKLKSGQKIFIPAPKSAVAKNSKE
jgi:LysM repeat protein